MERNFKDLHEMNRRKIQISVSCIYFLKRASSIDELHNYFLSPKILFLTKRFFYYEEKYMSETMTPLLLEDTWACSNIEHLLQSTAGNDQIQANSLLGFRLISRIADILQNKILVQSDEDQDVLEKEFSEEEEKQEEESEVFNYWFSPKPSILITRIQKFFEKNFINKIKNELSTWNQIHKNSFLGNFSKAMKNVKKDDNLKNKNYNEEELTINGQQIVYRLAMFVLMKEKNFQIKNDNSKKTSLSQKLDEFLKDFYKEKLAKEKPTIYEQMNMRNPLEFDSKKLRGKEYLEIVYQGLALSKERDLLSKYRNQFFDVNNSLFLDLTSSENFIKNKSDSPLKKRVIFELMDSTDSVEKSPYSNVNEKSSMKPKINLGNVLVGNKDILNKKGVEKLLETLSNNDFEEIINEVFASSKIY